MMHRSTLFSILLACAAVTSNAQEMVKDIISGSDAHPQRPCSCNGTLFFVAEDPQSLDGTKELWKTDGTAGGTVQVKDINTGMGAIPYSGDFRLTCMNNQVYFFADDGVHGIELWKSDGTSGGTVMVKDINPGFQNGYPTRLHVMNGALYFIAEDGVNGRELWKSDGTAGGTNMVKDILPGQYGESPFTKADFAELNGMLYFESRTATNGKPQLWRTDGTTSGTTIVKDNLPGHMNHLTPLNGKIIFSAAAQAGDGGTELYISDGTDNGTQLLKDVNPGNSGSNPSDLTVFNNKVYFVAITAANGSELWSTDGTPSGTAIVKDIRPGSADGVTLNSRRMTVFNNQLYFGASDGTSGAELWKTDGTEPGTVMVKDINAGMLPGVSWGNTELKEYNGHLYFAGNVNAGNRSNIELWRTDGTANGTTLVKEICADNSSNPGIFQVHNNVLFFTADDCVHGRELWKLDASVGISDGPEQLHTTNIYPNPAKGLVTIENGKATDGTYRILNTTGQTLLSGKTNSRNTTVDISILSAGVYFIETGAEQKQIFKLTVQ